MWRFTVNVFITTTSDSFAPVKTKQQLLNNVNFEFGWIVFQYLILTLVCIFQLLVAYILYTLYGHSHNFDVYTEKS